MYYWASEPIRKDDPIMTIDITIVNMLGILMLESIMLGLVCMACWKIGARGEFVPYWGGLVVSLLFSVCCVSLLNILFSMIFSPNSIVYAMLSPLATIVIALVGMYLGFTSIHKDRTDRRNAVSFGLGFASAQSITSIGIPMLTSFVYASSINQLGLDEMTASMSQADAESFREMANELAATPLSELTWMVAEIIAIVVLYTALAVPAFAVAHGKGDRKELVIIGAFLYVGLLPMSLMNIIPSIPLWMAETILLLAAAGTVVYARRIYNTLPKARVYDGRTRI